MAMVSRFAEIPEGLEVQPDGSWRAGGALVIHPPTLRYLKSHLAFDEQGGAFVVDGSQRVPVALQGPPLEVVSLVIDGAQGTARAVLDDGSEEIIREDSLGMDPRTGRFHCLVRGARAQAVLSRPAHQTLLANIGQEGGAFFLQAGSRRLPVRA
jgi:hypothetical protein